MSQDPESEWVISESTAQERIAENSDYAILDTDGNGRFLVMKKYDSEGELEYSQIVSRIEDKKSN